MKKDILIFMSDQHSGYCINAIGDDVVRTPNLDRIISEGTTFANAYTPVALCVPARSAFMTCKMPSQTGIYTNNDCINSCSPTFVHNLTANGYETVLIGRMHFVGDDQRHGFTKRLVGDITPTYWGRSGNAREGLGSLKGTSGEDGCLRVVGSREMSPVLEYDLAVIDSALGYLCEEHDKPQFIVVGTYAPHFPYLAYKEQFDYYRERVKLPFSYPNKTNYRSQLHLNKEKHIEENEMLNARAAYYAMVENMDAEVGSVYDKFNEFTKRRKTEGLFLYTSDHGDMLGENFLYGKKSFHENAIKVPMIFAGSGVKKGQRISEAVSLIDVGGTICSYSDSERLPFDCGVDLTKSLIENQCDENRCIMAQYIVSTNSEFGLVPCRMVRCGKWKYFAYYGLENENLLFNLEDDPHELNNVILQNTQKASELRAVCYSDWKPQEEILEFQKREMEQKMLSKAGSSELIEENEKYTMKYKY